MTKEELIDLLKLCNADVRFIEVVHMAYELGYQQALKEMEKDGNKDMH